MENYKAVQEEFWAGEFGDKFSDRAFSDIAMPVASSTALFSRVLSRTRNVKSVLEYGANVGQNLRAIKRLLPECTISAVEINEKAVNTLKRWGEIDNIYHESILDCRIKRKFDLVIIMGVLIHISPDCLDMVYDLIERTTGQYVFIGEYYSRKPVSLDYRGKKEKLFKRDFAGELLERFDSFSLLDYGFCYHRDPNFIHDDINWFLLEK